MPFRITETEVGYGWANNSVNTVIFRKNAVTSHKDVQFTAYYDEDTNLILAKKHLESDVWERNKTQYKGNAKDAHNTISIAVDGDGFLHVSWDHHDTRLRYAVSKTPLSLELGPEQPMTGLNEKEVSYPQFYNLKDGSLFFIYRSGRSGQGTLMANSYNLKRKTWKQVHENLIDGEQQRNAYWQTVIDGEGNIHLSWVWRETWDVSTNHDIAYALSRDGGKTWEKSTGEKYELPISAENAEYAWRVPQNSSLINQTSMTTDKDGNPYISSYWNEENSTQFHVVYLKDGVWQKERTDFREGIFHLGGGGTKKIPISRPEILVDTKNNSKIIYLIFRDEERNNKISLAYKPLQGKEQWQIKDITKSSVGQWEPNYDTELFKHQKKLHIFVQKVTQVDGEGLSEGPPSPIRILEINKLPSN